MVALYCVVTMAAVICAKVDCWDVAIGLTIIALLVAFNREARRVLRDRASGLHSL